MFFLDASVVQATLTEVVANITYPIKYSMVFLDLIGDAIAQSCMMQPYLIISTQHWRH